MLERTVVPNGKRIKELRKARQLTQKDLVEQCGREQKIISKRTLENAESGHAVKESTLTAIAEVLQIPWKDLVLSDTPVHEPAENDSGDSRDNSTMPIIEPHVSAIEKLQFFGFNERTDAIKVLMQCQKQLDSKKARVICFTVHTLDDLFLQLLDVGVMELDVFMGTKEMARRLRSSRQEQLFDIGWGSHLGDLDRHIAESRLTIRFYDCPPSFTGVALDEDVYLINTYIWMPTLNWLKDREPEEYQAHWEPMQITRRPNVDDYTINACNMPSVLVVRGYKGPAGDAFQSLSQSFERVWRTLEKDANRPPDAGRKHYKAFEEMRLLQERLMEDERIATDRGIEPRKSTRRRSP